MTFRARAVAVAVIGAVVLAGRAGLAQESGAGHLVTPGAIEGRPDARSISPLQDRVDAAAPGATLRIAAGTYSGDLVIDKPVHLIGEGRPVLRGSGRGSVVRVRADHVTVEGFDIDGLSGGDLGRDSSGVHVTGQHVTVRDCFIHHALFGIYLREANGAHVEANRIEGIHDKQPGEKGSGIHVWNTDGFALIANDVREVRDGFYIQSSPHGLIARNSARDLRYGLHYMSSDDNVFEDNRFENGAAGAALMYSRRLTFRRNRFVRNRGYASVGLLLKTCDDVVAEDNLIADNARGLFLEGGGNTVLRRNVIALSDIAIILYDSTNNVRFEGNSFIANLSPLELVGRRTDTIVRGNYWSDHGQADLDGDGFADTPYRLSSAFDHLRSNLSAADLFAQGVSARALGAAERTFPVLRLVPVVDDQPLAHPPSLPAVPVESSTVSNGGSTAGLGVSALLLAAGAGTGVVGYRGYRRRRA